MDKFLVEHAKANVWCSPRQDRRLVIRPARVTRIRGVSRNFFLGRRNYDLPDSTNTYHVFQIGAIGAINYNLPDDKLVWHSLQWLGNNRHLLGRLYTHYGLTLPRKDVWVLFTEDRNILIAVKDCRPAIDIEVATEGLILELYTNAYFNSLRSSGETSTIKVFGRDVRTVTDRSQMVSLYTQLSADTTGVAYAFINGKKVSVFNSLTIALGDVVELVFDSSIYHTATFNVVDLETFNSTLDSMSKYIIHPEKTTPVGETIEYKDDLDIWLEVTKGNQVVSYYYQQSQDDSVRMLTHRDYSIPVSYLTNYVNDIDDFDSIDDLRLVVQYRHSGWRRQLQPDANRILELYKLSDTDILQAMQGIDATMPEWSAAGLEESSYPLIMRSLSTDITTDMVMDGYGYGAVSRTASNSNVQLVVNDAGVYTGTLPYLCRNGATVYEYSAGGLLLGIHRHNGGSSTWVAKNTQTRHIEAFQNKAKAGWDQYQGIDQVTMIPGVDYRLYKTPNYPEGYLTDQWVDVTDQEGTDYEIVNGVINWLLDPTAWMTCVRTNVHHCQYNQVVARTAGVLEFDLIEAFDVGGGPLADDDAGDNTRIAEIPCGKIDLWDMVSGRYLISGLDYVLKWPKVVITNKRYVNGDAPTTTIAVRMSGFCNSDLSIPAREEFGYVKYGRLSRNAQFNLRDDRVMQFVADGRTYLQSSVRFEEDAVRVGAALTNGAPYQIDPHYVTIGGVTDQGTEDPRATSLDLDSRISDYLTVRIPETVETTPSPIPERYPVFSPFCKAAITLVKSGVIPASLIEGSYNNTDIAGHMAPYLWLLDHDPTQVANLPDQNHVAIHPHDSFNTIELNIYEYAFVERVISLYLADRVDLTRFVEIFQYSE